MKFPKIESGLGYDAESVLFYTLQFRDIVGSHDDITVRAGPSADSDYFRMAGITDDHDRITLPALLIHYVMDFPDKRTSGVDHMKSLP